MQSRTREWDKRGRGGKTITSIGFIEFLLFLQIYVRDSYGLLMVQLTV